MNFNTHRPTGQSQHRLVLACIVVLGLGAIFALAYLIDGRRPATDAKVEEERLYLAGKTVRRLSLGFNGLVADWYWTRSLQYVGRKILSAPENTQIDHLGQLNLGLLAPLLDNATTLDPQFIEPYLYAAVVLSDVDVEQAISILRKGIAANPGSWVLYQHLGYIYWQQGNFRAASEAYDAGAKLPGAPPWMQAMKAKMLAEGGSRSVAREIYRRMYEQSADEKIKEMARLRLLQLDHFDQRDGLLKILSLYQQRVGRCPASWRELEPVFRNLQVPLDAAGAPLDPSGAPYVLNSAKCEIDLSEKTEIPLK